MSTTDESVQRGLDQSARGEVVDLGDFTQYATDDEPITEAEFLGLDDVIAKATERTKASEVAADMLVTLYRTGITPHPSKFDELRAAVEGWEANR